MITKAAGSQDARDAASASGATMNQQPVLQFCRECGWEGVRWEPPTTHGPNPTPASNLGDCPVCGEDLEPKEEHHE